MAKSNPHRHGERHHEQWHGERDHGYPSGSEQRGHREGQYRVGQQRVGQQRDDQQRRSQRPGWQNEWQSSARSGYRGERSPRSAASGWQPGRGERPSPLPGMGGEGMGGENWPQQWEREWPYDSEHGRGAQAAYGPDREPEWERSYGQGVAGSAYPFGSEPPRRSARRGPKGYTRTDERIREDICERLIDNDYIDSSDVSVNVQGGKVTLEGTVPQRQMKHAIEDMADGCPGVQDVDNRLQVPRPGSAQIPAQSEAQDSTIVANEAADSGKKK